MLTAEQIADGKRRAKHRTMGDVNHEHDDCIRIAYAWLDAQKTRAAPFTNGPHVALKHLIEKWGGRYVSEADVTVAALLHPKIEGTYPYFNLSLRRTLPSFVRLEGIAQANTMQNYRDRMRREDYAEIEPDPPRTTAA